MFNLMPGSGLGKETSNRLGFGLGSWGELVIHYIHAAASIFSRAGVSSAFQRMGSTSFFRATGKASRFSVTAVTGFFRATANKVIFYLTGEDL